jgi:hypothetical protein
MQGGQIITSAGASPSRLREKISRSENELAGTFSIAVDESRSQEGDESEGGGWQNDGSDTEGGGGSLSYAGSPTRVTAKVTPTTSRAESQRASLESNASSARASRGLSSPNGNGREEEDSGVHGPVVGTVKINPTKEGALELSGGRGVPLAVNPACHRGTLAERAAMGRRRVQSALIIQRWFRGTVEKREEAGRLGVREMMRRKREEREEDAQRRAKQEREAREVRSKRT